MNNTSNDYIKFLIMEDIKKDDTIYSLANKYYNEELYYNFYKSINEYINEIKKINGFEENILTPFQSINIPVIIHKDNVYLERINILTNKISNLKEWIQYKVDDKDTLSSLAYEGAKDIDEAYSILESIINKNNLKTNSVKTGSIIYIINPEIGYLKREIFQLNAKLKESLKAQKETK